MGGKEGDIDSSKRNRVLMSPAPYWGDRCADDVMLKGNRAGRGRGKSRGEESESTGGQWRTGKAEGGKKQGWRRISLWQPSACPTLMHRTAHLHLAFDPRGLRVASCYPPPLPLKNCTEL